MMRRGEGVVAGQPARLGPLAFVEKSGQQPNLQDFVKFGYADKKPTSTCGNRRSPPDGSRRRWSCRRDSIQTRCTDRGSPGSRVRAPRSPRPDSTRTVPACTSSDSPRRPVRSPTSRRPNSTRGARRSSRSHRSTRSSPPSDRPDNTRTLS